MDNKRFYEIVEQQIKECKDILGIKGHDYPMDDSDRLSNFKHTARRAGVSTLQTWLTFFLKHEECLEKFVRGQYGDSEPIEGRIADAINYLLLLRALIEEDRHDKQLPSVLGGSVVEYKDSASPIIMYCESHGQNTEAIFDEKGRIVCATCKSKYVTRRS